MVWCARWMRNVRKRQQPERGWRGTDELFPHASAPDIQVPKNPDLDCAGRIRQAIFRGPFRQILGGSLSGASLVDVFVRIRRRFPSAISGLVANGLRGLRILRPDPVYRLYGSDLFGLRVNQTE